MFKISKYFWQLIRFQQPTGTFLLLLPCFSAIVLISKIKGDYEISKLLYYFFLFGIGAFLMRSAGCIINDLYDYKIDQQVSRTKNRPLAAKKITQLQALKYLSILLILALIILWQFNFKTIISGFFALILVVIYPLLKRITYFPQLFLGITFNYGVIMASFAMLDYLDISIIFLYLAFISWTFFYDTIYAFQDIEDDLKIGVKSSAIYFAKNNARKNLLKMIAITFLLLIIVGILEEFSHYYFLTIFVNTFFMSYKLFKCNFMSPKNCLSLFKKNIIFGGVYLIAIIFG